MRHFATESGKSKGQFYTPAEVSRVMAKVIGVGSAKPRRQTIYDPTCGSGSLLLKAHDEAKAAPARPCPLRAGDGQCHGGAGQDEHDPARLPHGRHLEGQHPLQPARWANQDATIQQLNFWHLGR